MSCLIYSTSGQVSLKQETTQRAWHIPRWKTFSTDTSAPSQRRGDLLCSHIALLQQRRLARLPVTHRIIAMPSTNAHKSRKSCMHSVTRNAKDRMTD